MVCELIRHLILFYFVLDNSTVNHFKNYSSSKLEPVETSEAVKPGEAYVDCIKETNKSTAT